MNDFYKWIRGTFLRLMFLLHWIGFLCIFVVISLIANTLIQGEPVSEIPMGIVQTLRNTQSPFVGTAFISYVFWLALTHYPIKWLLTGNSSFFPWRS